MQGEADRGKERQRGAKGGSRRQRREDSRRWRQKETFTVRVIQREAKGGAYHRLSENVVLPKCQYKLLA